MDTDEDGFFSFLSPIPHRGNDEMASQSGSAGVGESGPDFAAIAARLRELRTSTHQFLQSTEDTGVTGSEEWNPIYLRRKLREAEDRIAELEDRVDPASGASARKRARRDHDQDVSDAEDSSKTERRKLRRDLERERVQHETEKNSLLREVDTLRQRCETQGMELRQLRRQLEDVQRRADARMNATRPSRNADSQQRSSPLSSEARTHAERLRLAEEQMSAERQRWHSERNALEDAMDKRRADWQHREAELNEELATLRSKVAELEPLRSQVEHFKSRAETAESRVAAAETSGSQDQENNRANLDGLWDENARLRKALDTSQTKLKRLQHKAASWEDTRGATCLLEERLRTAERRAKDAHAQATAAEQLRVRLEGIEHLCVRWQGLLEGCVGDDVAAATSREHDDASAEQGRGQANEDDDDDDDSANRPEHRLNRIISAAVRTFSRSEGQRLLLSERVSAAEATCATLRQEAETLRNARSTARAELARAEDAQETAEAKAARAERLADVARREADGMRALLRTYDSAEQAATKQVSSGDEDPRDAQIRFLEEALKEAQEALAKTHEESKSMTPSRTIVRARDRAERAEAALSEEQRRSRKLEAALERLERENAALTAEVGRGAFDASRTKVLHLRRNPVDDAHKARAARLAELEEEVTRLRRGETAGSGEAGSRSGGLEPPAPNDASSMQLRIQRLREVFQEKMHTFREAVYLLTGYKVDMHSRAATGESSSDVVQLTLRSMYAEHEQDKLMFQMRDGRLEIMETPFCKQLDENLTAYVTQCHSVPAFLSAITLDLFEKQTFTLSA